MLATELKELFIDFEKSASMMFGVCSYDPAYVSPYSPEAAPREVCEGYGEELSEMGVEYSVMAHYGGEGQGRDYITIWKFTRGEEIAYFEFEGWYDSYEGATYEKVYEVGPKRETITVWE